jgi:hypothetical protein
MAGSQYSDLTQLAGVIKETYAKKLKDARVNFTVLQDKFKLDESSPIGNYFHVPVLLTQSQSTLYDASGGTQALPNPIAPVSQDAQIPAMEISERMYIPFGAAAKFDAGGQVSFVSSTTLKMLALNKAVKRQIEWSLLYGGSGVATLSVGSSAASVTYTMGAGSFGAGYLVGAENQNFDVYDPTFVTKRNTNGALQCTAVDIEAGTITLNGAAADNLAVQANDVLVRRGSRTYEITGLATQISNAGTLFNINAANYSLFRGTTYSSVGNLTVAKVNKGVSKARNRGADGDMTFLCSANGYAALLNDLNATRRTDYSYSKTKLETGAESITLHSSNGAIEILEHPFVKDNDAFLLPTDEVMRPGISDVTDNLAGMDLSVMSATTNAWDFRVWTAQASFLAAPAHAVYFTGVTYP